MTEILEEETKDKKCWARVGLVVKIKTCKDRPELEGVKAKVIKVNEAAKKITVEVENEELVFSEEQL